MQPSMQPIGIKEVTALFNVESEWSECQKFEARIDQLTSYKEDLLTRLRCCEEELKIKDECENIID